MIQWRKPTMENILEKLYYGEISPCSLPSPNTKRYKEASLEVEQINQEILAKYPDSNELIERLEDAIHVTAACESLQDFERGFRLGAQIMINILTTE